MAPRGPGGVFLQDTAAHHFTFPVSFARLELGVMWPVARMGEVTEVSPLYGTEVEAEAMAAAACCCSAFVIAARAKPLEVQCAAAALRSPTVEMYT